MLNWISSRLKSSDSDHPLGSDKGIVAYLAQLPRINPQSALQDVDQWLEHPQQLTADMPPEGAARAVERLDDSIQPSLNEAWINYFSDTRQDYLADRLLKTLEVHYRSVYHACRHTLEALAQQASQTGKEPDRLRLTRLAVRAMFALVQCKKIAQFNYQGPDALWWKTCHEVLFLARNLGILHGKVAAYPDSPEPTSVWREYLVGVLFEVIPLSNLTPPQMEALERTIRKVESHCLFIDSFTSQTPFRINLEATDGPSRCTPGQEGGPAWRYFGPGPAQAQLMKLRAAIQTGRKLPEWLDNCQCDVRTALDLLHLLIQHWSLTPPSRQQERQPLQTNLLVVAGLAMARRAIAASEFARSGRSLNYKGHVRILDLHRVEGGARPEDVPMVAKTPLETLQSLESTGIQQITDTWEGLDLSAAGLGARLPFRRPWHSIGALVGYRAENRIDWQIGIIRRLGRSHGKPNAGLTIFEGIPACAQVQLADKNAECPWNEHIPEAMGLGLLDAILVSREARLLLVPPDTYLPDRRADLIVGGKRQPVRLAGIQESGPDYQLILYRENEA
ncbi:MAG TPA: hypothetical protein VFK74_04985 [Azospira sp.]|nr:hypothetical protein [Azospira sp.]